MYCGKRYKMSTDLAHHHHPKLKIERAKPPAAAASQQTPEGTLNKLPSEREEAKAITESIAHFSGGYGFLLCFNVGSRTYFSCWV